MENTNNINYWKKIKKLKNGQPLTFIHTPKCAGTFTGKILKKFNIKNKGHTLATKEDGITFTIIRNPIDRFESLLNFRLDKSNHSYWPNSLQYNDESISLNEIIDNLSDKDIISFEPYRTLCYWSQNIDIFITIDKLAEFLSVFGYKVNIKEFKKVNVSNKKRGKINEYNRNRIANLYSDDMNLFKKVILD